VDNGEVRGRWAFGRAATLGFALGAIVLVGACTSPAIDTIGPTSTSAASPSGGTVAPPTASASSPSTSTTIADAEADGEFATDALATLDDLGDGWSTKQKAPSTARREGLAFDCPELVADHPGLGQDADAQTVGGPAFDRTKPPGQFVQSITVFAREADAEDAVAALHDPAAIVCSRELLGHKKGSAPVTLVRLDAEAWSIPDLGDDRAAFEVVVETSKGAASQSAHLGVAFVRVGRSVSFVGIFSLTSMSDAEIDAMTTAADKFVRASADR
jgi:hypothetical protein